MPKFEKLRNSTVSYTVYAKTEIAICYGIYTEKILQEAMFKATWIDLPSPKQLKTKFFNIMSDKSVIFEVKTKKKLWFILKKAVNRWMRRHCCYNDSYQQPPSQFFMFCKLLKLYDKPLMKLKQTFKELKKPRTQSRSSKTFWIRTNLDPQQWPQS